MNGLVLPGAVHLAVLVEADPTVPSGRRVCGVLGFADDGRQRHHQPIDPAVACPPGLARLVDEDSQLRLDLGEHTCPPASTAGQGWWTFTLPSIPLRLRHLPLADAVAALAAELQDRP
jgi:hypothetical protein